MTRYAFHFDGTRCTGCKTCEMACKDFKDLSVGTAFRKVYEVTLGTTERDANGCITSSCVSYPLSMSCNHCDDPACTKVCPTTAMHKDPETGLVSVDVDKCIGVPIQRSEGRSRKGPQREVRRLRRACCRW